MIKGAIIGCGWVANSYHIPAFRTLKGVEIVAVCDQDENIARVTARRWGIPRVYEDFSRLMAEENLDFVDICTPPQVHFPLSIQAMRSGLHILVEKPMAINLSQADEMLRISEDNNVKLCVAHNFLFSPVVQRAKALVDAGAIGDLVNVEIKLLERREMINKQSHWYHSLPGGVFGDFAPHAVYLESAFLGKVNSIKAIARKYSDFSWVAADELKVLLEAENAAGAFTISCNSPRASFIMDIFGTKKNLHIDNLTMSIVQHKAGEIKIRDLAVDDLYSSLQQAVGAVSILLKTAFGQKRWYTSGQRTIIQRFVESIRNNTAVPVTGEDGRETMRILDDIWGQLDILNSPVGGGGG